jgi:Las17-binding protein actin regulator
MSKRADAVDWAAEFDVKEAMMRRLGAGLLAALLLSSTHAAFAQKVEDFSDTIGKFRSIPQVQPYFESAYAYAVWRRIARGGLGIGAATGKGQVYLNGHVTGFSRLIDITIGLQAGGQAYQQIIFFRTAEAYERFTSGRFQFDAAASAVAVTASAQASAGTQGAQASAGAGTPKTAAAGGYQNDMQVFTMAVGGLMYQATIGGQKYDFKPVSN